jgi:hypothetical protein
MLSLRGPRDPKNFLILLDGRERKFMDEDTKPVSATPAPAPAPTVETKPADQTPVIPEVK